MRLAVVVENRAATHDRAMNGSARENVLEWITWFSVLAVRVPLMTVGWAVNVCTLTAGKNKTTANVTAAWDMHSANTAERENWISILSSVLG